MADFLSTGMLLFCHELLIIANRNSRVILGEFLKKQNGISSLPGEDLILICFKTLFNSVLVKSSLTVLLSAFEERGRLDITLSRLFRESLTVKGLLFIIV